MRKWLLILCALLFFDTQITGWIKEKTSLAVFREAGLLPGDFLAAGVSREDMELYLRFWEDLQYFPVAGRVQTGQESFSFENTWHEKRSYGGERVHEGCDIFGQKGESGYYPVISMTAGRVEQIGWLPLGGWRIGIRSPGGGYFYYAHLSGYAGEFQEGDFVEAGELLGFLGDTGYGEEGTKGKFPPHLHLGIYVKTPQNREYALNPYPVLQFLQERQKNFFY